MPERATTRPAPAWGLVLGTLMAFGGFLAPWFHRDGPSWFFSGWGYLTADDGPGWTLWVPVALGVALVSAAWARRNRIAARLSLAAVLTAGFFAATLVAASLDTEGDPWQVTHMTMSLGVPLMAIGLSIAVVDGVTALAAPRSEA
ncbi:hypothetical protein OWR29_45885 [Actinoplanes sp. Pm04-4]|uniref:DUF998 domain-containing protein n=1 Tax=Paractinoplanes pyxinae TaxID=2997416 RepID=A0ABT4BFQ4_9ACTN|nr:hypothetical protein [Actinoplanes pyxinae]MCY1145379.1 hypothetical protein [Actinoplanes pyxinae]